jgi:hypothetical protein
MTNHKKSISRKIVLDNVKITNSKIAIVAVNSNIRSNKLHLINNETGIVLDNSVIDMEDTEIK